MTISEAQLSDARTRLEHGASFAAVARFVGIDPAELKRALAPKLIAVHVVDVGRPVIVVTAGPLRIEGLEPDPFRWTVSTLPLPSVWPELAHTPQDSCSPVSNAVGLG